MTLQGPEEAERNSRSASSSTVTDFAAGGFFVLIAVIGAWSLWTNPHLELGALGSDPGPGLVPWIGVWVVGVGGLAQIGWALRYRNAGAFRKTGEFVPSRLWLPGLLIVSMIGYQMALRPMGFILATVTFAVPWVAIVHWRANGEFKPRHFLQLPVEAGLIVVGIYAVFRYGIHVPFP